MEKENRSAGGRVVGREFVSDFYGNAATLSEAIGAFPKTERELVRERIRYERDRERKLSALAANPTFQGRDGLLGFIATCGVDWNAAMREEVKLTDNQALYLGVYLLGLTKDGSLEVDSATGWPIHWSFCAVAKLLHAQNPERYRNRKGEPVGQQTVKDAVVPAFTRKLHAYLERIMPSVWPIEVARSVVEEQLGDNSHRVPHCKQ